MAQAVWAEAGQGWQGRETLLRLHGWSRQRRVILLRRKLKREHDLAIGADAALLLPGFVELEPQQQVWEYAALVTSLDDEILSLGQLYRDRGDAENGFDELKNRLARRLRQAGRLCDSR